MPEAKFKCLRCGHEYTGSYAPGTPQELTCPKCRSNSVWRLPEKKLAQKA